ncbi:MAG: FtsX-like permease family protein [Bacteroidota bacterium]
MWTNYFISVIRQWRKNSLYITLNILSLSAGIGLSIVALLNANFNLSFNHFYEDAAQVYRVIAIADAPNTGDRIGKIPEPVAEILQGQVAGVEHYSSYRKDRLTFRIKDRMYEESIGFIDDHFLSVFEYPDSDVLSSTDLATNSIILSHELAIKWMGTIDCIGQSVELIQQDGTVQQLQITQVLPPTPDNISFRFTALMSMDWLEKPDPVTRAVQMDGLFVKTSPSVQQADIEQRINLLTANHAELLSRYDIQSLELVSILDWPHEESEIKQSSFMQSLHPASVLGTFATAISILLLASFNYVNTSIAIAQRRIKEMAVRKVMGAGNKQLQAQWWFENFLTIGIAILLGCLLAYMLIPAYNAMLEISVIDLSFIPVIPVLFLLFITWVMIGLLCGLYPALLIARFNALEALIKRTKLKSNGVIAKVFITLQFCLTIYTLYCLFVFVENGRYVSNLDRGYTIDGVINVPLNEPRQFEQLANALRAETYARDVSGTYDAVGFNSRETNLTYQQSDYEAVVLSVGFEYINTLNLRLMQGESFTGNSWNNNVVIINEMLAENLNDPLNKTITLNGQLMTVIGVVEDFAHKPIMLGNKLKPVVMIPARPDHYRYLSFRSAGQTDMYSLDQQVSDLWYTLFPDKLYQGFLQEKVLKPIRTTTSITLTINTISAVLSVLISMIGLYSLMSLHIQKHIKEFGIRKVLGARVSNITFMINREIMVYLAIATVLGIFASDQVVNAVLDIVYSYHISTGVHHWGYPVIFMIFIILITIGKLVWRAASTNPVHHLRSE